MGKDGKGAEGGPGTREGTGTTFAARHLRIQCSLSTVTAPSPSARACHQQVSAENSVMYSNIRPTCICSIISFLRQHGYEF